VTAGSIYRSIADGNALDAVLFVDDPRRDFLVAVNALERRAEIAERFELRDDDCYQRDSVDDGVALPRWLVTFRFGEGFLRQIRGEADDAQDAQRELMQHLYLPIVKWRRNPDPPVPDGRRVLFVVANNALGGRTDDYTTWYDERHIPDTFEYYGFLGAQRFRRSELLVEEFSSPFEFLTLYEVAQSQVEQSIKAMKWAEEDRRVAKATGSTPAIPVSQSVSGPRFSAFYSASIPA
jgi:hypothetical protein